MNTTQNSLSWQAIKHVFDCPSLRLRTEMFLDDNSECIDLAIRDEPWSSGERLLVEVAISLKSNNFGVSLFEVFTGLSSHHARRVYEAIEMIRLDVGCSPVL